MHIKTETNHHRALELITGHQADVVIMKRGLLRECDIYANAQVSRSLPFPDFSLRRHYEMVPTFSFRGSEQDVRAALAEITAAV